MVVVALFAGCEKKPSPPSQPQGSASRGDAAAQVDTCASFVQHLRDRLGAIAKSRPSMLPMTIPADVELATARSGKPIDKPGVAMVVRANDTVMVGDETVKLADAEKLVDQYVWRPASEAAGMGRGPHRPWILYVWADKRVKIAQLAKLFKAELFEPTYFELRLLVAGEPPAPMDMALLDRPTIKKLLAGMPKDTETALIYRAKHMRDGGDPCATLPMAYVKYTEAGPVMLLSEDARLIPQAVEDCKCNLSDRDAFEYGVVSIMGAFHPVPHWVAMPALGHNDTRSVADVVK